MSFRSESSLLAGLIDHLYVFFDRLLAVLVAKDRERGDVHWPPSEERRQLVAQVNEAEQAWSATERELHQHVHIAIGAEVVPSNRAEQPHPADVPLLAERSDVTPGNR